jgi:capsular polysaccharide biosynthesis protein
MEKLISKYGQGLGAVDLYVSRKNFHNRRWVNEIEAEEMFLKKGFKIISPEKISFQDQVSIFSSAYNVAGSLGAGLSNICFSPPATKIMMIDNGMYDFFFYDLACLRSQEFSWIFTKKIAFENVTQLHEDWRADSSLIAAALTML